MPRARVSAAEAVRSSRRISISSAFHSLSRTGSRWTCTEDFTSSAVPVWVRPAAVLTQQYSPLTAKSG